MREGGTLSNRRSSRRSRCCEEGLLATSLMCSHISGTRRKSSAEGMSQFDLGSVLRFLRVKVRDIVGIVRRGK